MDEASRFRSNYFKQSNGYGAAFRLIPTKIATLEELGIPVVVKEFAHLRGGLVLVTGPTGSGKTTTQAAARRLHQSKLFQARGDNRRTD
jgi:twitching motility protein PilT